MVRILAATVAGLVFVPSATAIQGAQQISADPFATTIGQHETAVEPDSLSFGRTVVSVFQLGRILDGGATANGWATSNDGGTTWRSGVLPALTVHQRPVGPYSRVSDPVIAYDRVHGVWLAAALALRDTSADRLSSIVVSRSSDGVSWSGPVVVAPEIERFNHDKPWLVCDNSVASTQAGRCYAVWTTNPGRTGVLALAVSTDGGLTWSPPTVFERAQGSGWQPLVGPDGDLVVVYEGTAEIAAVVSRDGGRTFTSPVRVGALRATGVPGVRAPPLPSAEIDAGGRIFVAWQDCRFRAGCASNDIVFASSANGGRGRWNRVQRVPTWPELDGLPHFVPGLAVDASARGSRPRLALAFYVLTPRGCSADCQVAPMYISSADGGLTWSAPQPLAAAGPVDAFPLSTSGRFLGDYISTSFVDGGAAVPVFASASAPFDGRFHQGVFAVRVPPLESRGRLLRLGAATVSPRNPRVGQRVSVTVPVLGPSKATGVRCHWAVKGTLKVDLRRLAPRISSNRVTCRWLLRAAKPGTTILGPLQVLSPEEESTRMFSFRVRK